MSHGIHPQPYLQDARRHIVRLAVAGALFAAPYAAHAIESGAPSNIIQVVQFAETLSNQGCSGVLVGPNVVLTAEHCLGAVDAICNFPAHDPDCVESNVLFVNPNGLVARDVFVHPQRDLGLIILQPTAAPVTPMSVLDCDRVELDDQFRATGWGHTEDPSDPTGQYKKTNIELKLPFATNDELLMPTDVTCQGDSGGPLTRSAAGVPAADEQIVGILSSNADDGGGNPCGILGDAQPRGWDKAARIDRGWLDAILSDAVQHSDTYSSTIGVGYGPGGCSWHGGAAWSQGPTSGGKIADLELSPEQVRQLLRNDRRLSHRFQATLFEELTTSPSHSLAYLTREQVGGGDPILVEFQLRQDPSAGNSSTAFRTLTPVPGTTPVPAAPAFNSAATYEFEGTLNLADLMWLDQRREETVHLRVRITTDVTHGCAAGTTVFNGDWLDWDLGIQAIDLSGDFDDGDTPWASGTCDGADPVCPQAAADCSQWPGQQPRYPGDLPCPPAPSEVHPTFTEMLVFGQGNQSFNFAGCHSGQTPPPHVNYTGPLSGGGPEHEYPDGGYYSPELPGQPDIALRRLAGCMGAGGVTAPFGGAAQGVLFANRPSLPTATMKQRSRQFVTDLLACGCEFEIVAGYVTADCQ